MEREKAAVRNAAVVGVVLSSLTGLRLLKRKARGGKAGEKDKPAHPPGAPLGRSLPKLAPLGTWEEAARCSAGVGLASETYGLLKDLIGRPAAGAASLAPLRLLMNDPRLKASYKFLVAYAVGQTVLELLPWLKKRSLLIMLFSTSQLLTWWLCADNLLPRDYQDFLHYQGKIDRLRVLKVRSTIYEGGTYSDLFQFCFPKMTGGQFEFDTERPSTYLNALVKYFLHHMTESVPFYVKVYSLRFLVFMIRGRSKNQVSAQVTGMLMDILRSASFLSMYCSQAFVALLTLAWTMPNTRINKWVFWAALSTPGLALLVETPSQQKTIASYCATFGVYPILEHFGLFDVAGVAACAAAGAGKVPPSLPFSFMWNENPQALARKAVATGKGKKDLPAVKA